AMNTEGKFSQWSHPMSADGLFGRRALVLGATGVGLLALGEGAAESAARSSDLSGSMLGVNVRDFGAIGDGIEDDTPAVFDAIEAAAGGVVYFPAGTYAGHELVVRGKADLFLSAGAILQHREGAGDSYMIGFTGTF